MKLYENQIIDSTIGDYMQYDSDILPAGVVFNNNGCVIANYTTILGEIFFNNKGIVNLHNLLETNAILNFNNEGDVALYYMKKIGLNLIFNNTGDIYLNKNVDMSELNYEKLLNLYNKLTTHNLFLNKKEIDGLLISKKREYKLNKIL